MYRLLYLFPFLALFSCQETIQSQITPFADSAAVVVCTRVLDGDTWAFEVESSDKRYTEEFKVRCLGFDAFETRRGDRLREQADEAGISEDSALVLGLLQKAYADSLLTGKEVTIVRDYKEPNLDVYGRLLRNCYVRNIPYLAKP